MTNKIKSPLEIAEELLRPKKPGDTKETAVVNKPAIKKEAKALPPPKRYYEIKIESMIPATIFYRALAETPEQALDQLKSLSPINVKHKLQGRRDQKLTVSESGSSIIKLTKNLVR